MLTTTVVLPKELTSSETEHRHKCSKADRLSKPREDASSLVEAQWFAFSFSTQMGRAGVFVMLCCFCYFCINCLRNHSVYSYFVPNCLNASGLRRTNKKREKVDE